MARVNRDAEYWRAEAKAWKLSAETWKRSYMTLIKSIAKQSGINLKRKRTK